MKVEKEIHQLMGSDLNRFIFAGNATFTILNESTGNRFTFRIRKAGWGSTSFNEKNDIFYISVLTGSDNNTSFSFLGTYFNGSNKRYSYSMKSRIGIQATSNRVISWFFNSFITNPSNYAIIKIFHENKCGKCGKKLTTPESVKSGLGPHCAGKTK